MTTPALTYRPERDGYSCDPGYGVISTKLDGGASRMRLDMINAAHTVNLRWMLSGYDYTLFMGFFRDTLVEATIPFLADLLTDIGTLTTHKMRCVNGQMPRLTANQGDQYFIQSVVEVERNPTHTGTLRFTTSPSTVDTLTVPLPEYLVGDKFRIVNSFLTGITGPNFDGTYVITSLTSTSVSATGASGVNAQWSAGGFPFNLSATITRVPT